MDEQEMLPVSDEAIMNYCNDLVEGHRILHVRHQPIIASHPSQLARCTEVIGKNSNDFYDLQGVKRGHGVHVTSGVTKLAS